MTENARPSTVADDAEQALIARLRRGDDSAFSEVVHAHLGRLLAVAKRITRSADDAEDVVQDAFLSAFRAVDRFDGRATLSTWLHRIVVNTALMKLRSRRGRGEASIEALMPRFENGMHAERPQSWVVADGSARHATREALWHGLEQLPEELRTVVVLRDLEGMESKEVATQLGIRDAAVRQRLHRGRLALLKLLAPVMTEVLR